jgi:hypothetical protein
MLLSHPSYEVHVLREDARRQEKGKGSTKNPTGMITEIEFITHPLSFLRFKSHRYGMLGIGVPGISKFFARGSPPCVLF